MNVLQQLIDAARKAHPAFRFATAAAGVAAFVVLFSRFGVSGATIVLGSVIFLGLMILFVVFARLARLTTVELALPAKIALWTVVLLSLASLILLFSSTFFDVPLPIRSKLMGAPGAVTFNGPRAMSGPKPRVAVVIGNAAYERPQLIGPVADMQAVADTLRSVGFRVKPLTNATTKQILEAWKEIGTIASVGGIALLYYSGHGARQEGDDFILPIDTPLFRPSTNWVNVTSLLRGISAFDGKLDGASGDLILYSTSAGGMAVDTGPNMKTSPFASAFTNAIRDSTGDVRAVFKRISDETQKMTDGRQVPWLSGSFGGKFSFRDQAADADIGMLRIVVFDASRP